MKQVLLIAGMLLLSITGFARQPADKIIGKWESVGGDVKLHFDIFKQDGKYFGRLLWASNMYESDGKTPKNDFKNPDNKLQSRSRKNIVNITGLQYEDGEYINGKLYNPSEGDTYSLKAELKSADELHFRGYMGISLLGKTMKFKRMK